MSAFRSALRSAVTLSSAFARRPPSALRQVEPQLVRRRRTAPSREFDAVHMATSLRRHSATTLASMHYSSRSWLASVVPALHARRKLAATRLVVSPQH